MQENPLTCLWALPADAHTHLMHTGWGSLRWCRWSPSRFRLQAPPNIDIYCCFLAVPPLTVLCISCTITNAGLSFPGLSTQCLAGRSEKSIQKNQLGRSCFSSPKEQEGVMHVSTERVDCSRTSFNNARIASPIRSTRLM